MRCAHAAAEAASSPWLSRRLVCGGCGRRCVAQVRPEVFDAFKTSMDAGRKRDATRRKQSIDDLKERARGKLKVARRRPVASWRYGPQQSGQ